jgi:hypothetical protein
MAFHDVFRLGLSGHVQAFPILVKAAKEALTLLLTVELICGLKHKAYIE